MIARMLMITIGFLLDYILGDPENWWHPVRGIGAMVQGLEKLFWKLFRISDEAEQDKGKKRFAGGLLVFLVVLVATGIPWLIMWGAKQLHPYVYIAVGGILCYPMLALRSLRKAGYQVFQALKDGDLARARVAVSKMVGRDTEKLDANEVTRAAVESIAENSSDGEVAPLLFMLIFGIPGGWFYKAVNTMDSMLGYRNDRYRYFGTAAARLDDICNWIPARITALFMIAASWTLRMDYKNAFRIWKRDRNANASPNAAHPESACAGALDVVLLGDATYEGKLVRKETVGDDLKPIEFVDINRANYLILRTANLVYLIGMVVLYFV